MCRRDGCDKTLLVFFSKKKGKFPGVKGKKKGTTTTPKFALKEKSVEMRKGRGGRRSERRKRDGCRHGSGRKAGTRIEMICEGLHRTGSRKKICRGK